jgi:hypothetical protein
MDIRDSFASLRVTVVLQQNVESLCDDLVSRTRGTVYTKFQSLRSTVYTFCHYILFLC